MARLSILPGEPFTGLARQVGVLPVRIQGQAGGALGAVPHQPLERDLYRITDERYGDHFEPPPRFTW